MVEGCHETSVLSIELCVNWLCAHAAVLDWWCSSTHKRTVGLCSLTGNDHNTVLSVV